MWVVNKFKSIRKLLFQKQELKVNPEQSRIPVSDEDKEKSVKILAECNHGIFHLKYTKINNVVYHTYAQTTHHPNPEMEENCLSHEFFIGKTRANHFVIFHAPIKNTLPYINNDYDNIISPKQEILLINSLKNI
jgi:hypothetical protein